MSSVILQFPPLDGSLLFPDLINFHVENNPTFPVFVYSNEKVLTEISFLEFGRAAHRVAHTLRPSRQGLDGEVVMIIANTDTILYHAVIVGLSIAGWVPFPVSPRNTAAAVAHLMKKTHCSRIVTLDHAHKALIDSIHQDLQDTKFTVFELPTLRYVFPRLGHETAADPFVAFPSASKRPDPDSPAIYMHSSGSTGFPKAIPHSYRIQIQWFVRDSARGFIDCPAPRRINSMALPSFHGFGIIAQLYIPVASLVTTVVYAPCTGDDPFAQPVIPTGDNVVECLKRIPSNTIMIVPTLLEQIAISDEAIEILKKFDSVLFGGGPLPFKVGEKLYNAGVRLVTGYGGTEFGFLVAEGHKQDCGRSGWMWMRFPDEPKIRWISQGGDTYELHLLTTELQYMSVENLPDVKGYATSDIFVKHPSKDLWKIVGRTDDLIILASGEKTVPTPMESIIGSSPLVQGVVMFGRERNQVGILVEPSPAHFIDVDDEKAVANFRNKVWPVIEEANMLSPAFSRIFKEMILITSVVKPMKRTPKGTVQRKVTLDAYEAEINILYEGVEASSVAPDGLAEPSSWNKGDLEKWLMDHAVALNPIGRIDPHTDLFVQGFDSLSATFLRNRILGTLRTASDPEIKKAVGLVSPNVVFEHPTIHQLSSHISVLVTGNAVGPAQDLVAQHKEAINIMIEKYTVGLEGPVNGVLPSSALTEPSVVLLTGSTGSLGTFLLSELLESPVVERIFAFNRPVNEKSIDERQEVAFRDRGLAIELLKSDKLVYIEADASAEKCGLSLAQHEEIRNLVTLIIHNAWRLDFNLGISSYEDNIRASRNLIDLALESSKKQTLRFLFTSSVGIAQSWDSLDDPFPEEVQPDPSAAIGSGYGEAKYAVERILMKSGLHATCLRIGQIVGGVGGSWATTDWFPILVKSSIALGALPEAAGVVSWLRQRDVASAILEIGFFKETLPPALNLTNPRSVSWAEIIAFVRRSIIKRRSLGDDALPIIPFGDWFAMLEKRAESTTRDDLREIPAIKLVEFFRKCAQGDHAIRSLGIRNAEAAGIANMSITKAQQISPTMASMSVVGEVEVDAWVEYWISKGAL